jgi:hypothetical protein
MIAIEKVWRLFAGNCEGKNYFHLLPFTFTFINEQSKIVVSIKWRIPRYRITVISHALFLPRNYSVQFLVLVFNFFLIQQCQEFRHINTHLH